MEYKLKITGMHCEKCKERLLGVLKNGGFSKVNIDLDSGVAVVKKFGKVDASRVDELVVGAGFGVEKI